MDCARRCAVYCASGGERRVKTRLIGRISRPVLEAPTVIACFEDMKMVHQAIEQCRCHLGITEDIGPFAEAQIGRDDNAGLLIEFAQQMEEKRSSRWAER